LWPSLNFSIRLLIQRLALGFKRRTTRQVVSIQKDKTGAYGDQNRIARFISDRNPLA
jgi:hypothetical protein